MAVTNSVRTQEQLQVLSQLGLFSLGPAGAGDIGPQRQTKWGVDPVVGRWRDRSAKRLEEYLGEVMAARRWAPPPPGIIVPRRPKRNGLPKRTGTGVASRKKFTQVTRESDQIPAGKG